MYILYAHLSVRTYMYWLLLLNVNQTACVGNSFESVLFFPSPQSMLFPHLHVILNESILLFGQFARSITYGFKTIIRNERFRDNL